MVDDRFISCQRVPSSYISTTDLSNSTEPVVGIDSDQKTCTGARCNHRELRNANPEYSTMKSDASGWVKKDLDSRNYGLVQPNEKMMQPEVKALPIPPSLERPWEYTQSKVTALNNYLASLRKAAEVRTTFVPSSSSEPASQHIHSAVFLIDGKEYGSVRGTDRKKVHEYAALQALDNLYREDPTLMQQSFSYLSIFKEFVRREMLFSGQPQWTSVQKGPDCNPTWVCTVSRCGIAIGQGAGATRKASEECATRNAAENWG